MKKELLKYGFIKIPNSNLLQLNDILIYFTKADLRTRTFNIEELNIDMPSINKYFEHIFILVEIENKEKYLLIEKDINNMDFGFYKRNKIGIPTWKYKFNIIPSFNDEVISIAIIQNIFSLNNELNTEVVLDKESIICLLEDYSKESIGR